jgi:hypothetical protein
MTLPANWSWGGFPCPAVQGLAYALERNYTYFANSKKNRLQWPGQHFADRHAAGLALDIMLDDHGGKVAGANRAWALEFIELMKETKCLIGWRQIIFQDKIVKCDENNSVTVSPWGKDDHKDHIHIDWVSWSFGVKEFNGTRNIPGADIAQKERAGWMEAVKQTLWDRSSPLAISDSVRFHCNHQIGTLKTAPQENK